MPAPISFFDMSCTTSPPGSVLAPIAVTLGPNWQPGDIRVFCQDYVDTNGTLNPNTYQSAPGFTYSSGSDAGLTSAWNLHWGVGWRRLVAGDTDTFIAYQYPSSMALFNYSLFTIRGVDPGTNPSIAHLPYGLTFTSSTAYPVTSFSVTATSTAIIAFYNWGQPLSVSYAASGADVATPSGWTELVATSGSGITYAGFGNDNPYLLVGKSFVSSGSTGTVTFPGAPSPTYGGSPTGSLHTGDNLTAFAAEHIVVKAAPDVSPTVTAATTTTTTASATTFSVSTAVSPTVGSASTVATATTAFNPLYGVWLSDPQTLTGDPVTGSVIRWVQTTPAVGSTVKVETSINNGASWDLATNNGQIPRLATGDTTTAAVLVRVTFTRVNGTDTPPEVASLEVQVSANASVDELVPVGHGMIDKTTINAVGGVTGTGTVTNVTSSSAVISRGGGQTGGGASIKVHVTDLSGSIKRNVWAQPFTVPSGLNYGVAAQAMVVNRLPDQTQFAISSTSRVTPLLVYGMQQGGDPWQDIQDLAAAIGFEAFFGAKGVFTFRPVPDPSIGDAVWAFDETSTLLVSEATRELSNDQTFNHVIVVGQSTSTSNPVTAEAFDNNPSSPTYILGPYGEVTERLTFSTITTQDQAQAAANALLLNSLGGADTVTITVVPQPALEPGDIVKINISDVNVDGNYMINSMNTSLSPADPQQLVCFRQSTS